MEIQQSNSGDIDQIFNLYDQATSYQKEVGIRVWKGFERPMVLQEIEEGRQYKIIVDAEIACVFVITFNDPLIWKEKDADPAIYIHRVATNPKFRGQHFVKHIVAWARQYALQCGKTFIRLDTGSGNEKLNNYYVSCGFSYLGVTSLEHTGDLPEHYKEGTFSLFELLV